MIEQIEVALEKLEKQAGKNFRFTLTTNGMLIDDDVIDFTNREMSNVVLSLDGRREVHDRFRVDYIANELYKILPGKQAREDMLQGYREVRERLGDAVAPDNAARIMLRLLGS